MKCRSCSSEIDDKAIVCYRCGTPTADPAARNLAPDVKRSRRRWVWIALLVALALAVYLLLFKPAM